MNSDNVIGVINDVQKMSINDGPGYRTVVFFKGCYLNCEWCHNPEGKRRYPEVIPYMDNCNGCGKCVTACSTDALKLNEAEKPVIDYGLCTTCLQCVRACKHDGLIHWGRISTVGDIIKEVEADIPFYKTSGGGLTISGGEPMSQPEFARAMMESAKKRDMHTALDTCGYAPWEDYEQVLEFTDMVLYDLKMIDNNEHVDYAGVSNKLILKNAERIAGKNIEMRMRVPIIPGRNDSEEALKETAKFIQNLGPSIIRVDLLPYHPYAGVKYKAFGMDYDFPIGEGIEDEPLRPFVNLFLDYVEEVTVGG